MSRERDWSRANGLGQLPFKESRSRGRRESISRKEFRNLLLGIMDEKALHWSLSGFAGIAPKEKLVHQFRSEYGAFVKNFPDYMEGVLNQNPPAEVAADLEENIAEERYGAGARETLTKLKEQGVISYVPADTAHPELFKLIPRGLGFDMSDFDDFDTVPLSEKAQAFQDFLFDATHTRGWAVGAVIATIFLEGKHDWELFAKEKDFRGRTPHTPVKDMRDHKLAVYGAGPDDLMLTLAHHGFNGAEGAEEEHRRAAWRMVSKIPPSERPAVVHSMREALYYYNEWRDEIAEQCGLEMGGDGKPFRAA